MCNNCGSSFPCNCIQQVNVPCTPCNPCTQVNANGCTHTWDFSCVIYNKNGNAVNELDGLNLPNGTTLKIIIEAIDEKIKQLTVTDWTLNFLRTSYVINTLQQFGVSVDQALKALQDEIDTINTTIEAMGYLGEVTSDPAAENGQYWFRTDTDELKIKLNGSTRIITIT